MSLIEQALEKFDASGSRRHERDVRILLDSQPPLYKPEAAKKYQERLMRIKKRFEDDNNR